MRVGRAILHSDDIVRSEGQLDVQRGGHEVGTQLAVDVDFPPNLVEFRWGTQFREVFIPDIEEIVEGEVTVFWRFDVDDAVVFVGVHPIDTTTVGCDADAFGKLVELAIDIDGEVDMDMVGELFAAVTRDAVSDGMGGVDGDD